MLDAATGATAVLARPGDGLTTFVVDVLERAGTLDLAVLQGTGRPRESHIDLALLREVAATEDGGRLARALTEAGPTGAANAVLEWATATTQPTLIIVDDLHLADPTSADALAFLARRTNGTSVVAVVGTHVDADLPTIELRPLDVDTLMAIVSDRCPDVDEGVARRVARLAEGSPLVAVEIARALDDRQRAGLAPLPAFAVAASPIRHVFADSIRALPDTTRRALCVAAAEPSGEIRLVAGALALLGGSIDDLDAAEEAEIIELRDGAVRFDHPIRRSVSYRQLAPASRRAAHRALAAVLDAPADAERRAAHLAAGLHEPDERVAADLEFLAEAAERRRDHLEAVRWWEAAARLSPGSSDAERRRARAVDAAAPRNDPIAGLTTAERRVAAVVAAGSTNKAAAATLFLSVKTVDAHLQSIYRKLGIGSRTELAVLMTLRDAEDRREEVLG